ncbi:MAG: hypothetical protein IJ512_05940 [Ruminococcus sp.]|nr:hypothetical protein [Ruminococcus sp.]
MTTFKKIFAAATAAATIGVMSMASLAVSAAPAAVDAPPYEVVMSIQAGAEKAWDTCPITVSDNGSYTSEYTFTIGSGTVELLLFDSSLNLYSYAPEETADVAKDTSVRMTIDNIKIVRVDGSEETVAYNGPSDGAFRTGDNGASMRINILNEWQEPNIFDISKEFPNGGVNAGDKIVVDWTITGLTAASTGGEGDTGATTTTTTASEGGNNDTTTTTTKKSGGSTNNSNKSTTKAASNSTTSTVSQTADAGVVAIVVGAAAAASLAVGAMTIKRKRK